ncbi:hypothetical protein A9Q96_10105 [Rhodobacterales bacterium 52_120_T64]|nr:hypothetical protein A9Q96_10105 [Rhodobacterales bacterium 52_120_T64]
MSKAIFLSAGVPDPKRGPEFAATADTVAINAAVSALVHVALGRRPLVWGGHPAITPMIWEVSKNIDIDYGKWVTLYQSCFFEDAYPDDNEQFKNTVFTKNVGDDLGASLLEMRRRMFSEHEFETAVFIGGMGGIIAEFELFKQYQPEASVVPVVSTGGATLNVADQMSDISEDLSLDLDYVALFHRHLNISTRENRYTQPEGQPEKLEERLWHDSEAKS